MSSIKWIHHNSVETRVASAHRQLIIIELEKQVIHKIFILLHMSTNSKLCSGLFVTCNSIKYLFKNNVATATTVNITEYLCIMYSLCNFQISFIQAINDEFSRGTIGDEVHLYSLTW